MKIIDDLKALDRDQRATFIASALGWTLDAFDFFLMVFVVKAVAKDFHAAKEDVLWAITLTLMFRPLGALVFGRLADRFGRRPILMINVLSFSFFELASAFAPSLAVFLVLRALFGFAMGGEWGIGSSLVMESIPAQSRGTVSGILQEGYALGYLLAAVVYGLFFNLVGWRGMFVIGVLPAALVFYIRMSVKESPVWQQNRRRSSDPLLHVFPANQHPINRIRHGKSRKQDLATLFRLHWKTFGYVILLMTAFTFFSHGTQDLYPTFLQEKGLPTGTVSTISIVANIGAIIGGVTFGFYSQRIGRRRAIIIAALLALPIIPLWAFSTTPLMLGLGAFLIQIAVQGAWGVVPAHLNELSPDELRGTFPGFAYQLGNFLASSNAVIQGWIAARHGGNFGLALALVAAVAAIAVAMMAALGKEARHVTFGEQPTPQ